MTTNEPTALVSASASAELRNEPSSASIEEVQSLLEREATMGPSKVFVMFTAGAVAAIGMTNSVHLVIGAMVIAPGFEPFSKLALRTTGRPARSGAVSST